MATSCAHLNRRPFELPTEVAPWSLNQQTRLGTAVGNAASSGPPATLHFPKRNSLSLALALHQTLSSSLPLTSTPLPLARNPFQWQYCCCLMAGAAIIIIIKIIQLLRQPDSILQFARSLWAIVESCCCCCCCYCC